jgi:hypothetical protein
VELGNIGQATHRAVHGFDLLFHESHSAIHDLHGLVEAFVLEGPTHGLDDGLERER